LKNFILAALFFLPMVSMAQELKLNTEKASVSFEFPAEKVTGSVSGIDATLKLNFSDLGSSVVKGSADVSTLTTNNKMRDKHLKSSDYFHAAKYPKMEFTSTSLAKEGDAYVAKGTLTIKGVSKEVSFQMKTTDAALVMKTTINADDFGVSPKKREKSTVKVTISVPLSE